jgi:hypothetical protein
MYAESLRKGVFPLWDPRFFQGTPFAAEPQMTAFYPASFLQGLSLPLGLAFKLLVVGHLLFAALWMYQLVRGLGAPPFGGAVAALAYGLNAQVQYWVLGGWIGPLQVIAWAPTVVCAYLKAVRSAARTARLGWLTAGGVAFALQLLAGHPEWAYYTAWIIALHAIYSCFLGPRGFVKRVTRALWQPGMVLLLGLLLAAVQVIPTLEMLMGSSRLGGSVAGTERVLADFHPAFLPLLLVPRLYGPMDMNLSVDSWMHVALGRQIALGETVSYGGMAGVLFAIAAVLLADRKGVAPARFWGGLALIGLMLSMERTFQLQAALGHILPVIFVFRVPARFMFLWTFSVSVLAGLGMGALMAHRALLPGRLLRAWGILLGLLFIVFLVSWLGASAWQEIGTRMLSKLTHEGYTPHWIAADIKGWVERTLSFSQLQLGLAVGWGGLAALIVLALQRKPEYTRACCLGILGLMAADLAVSGHPFLKTVREPQELHRMDRSLLPALPPPHPLWRVYVWDGNALQLGVNSLAYFGYFMASGYDTLVLKEYTDWAKRASAPETACKTLREASVRFVIASREVRLDCLKPRQGTPIRLYEVDRWRPRVELVSSLDDLGAPAVANAPGQILNLRDVSPNRVEVRFKATESAWLLLRDTDYPGWTAGLDGKPDEIVRAGGRYRAVNVPPGEHHLVFEFWPRTLWIGGLVSGLTVLAMVSVWAFLRRTKAPGGLRKEDLPGPHHLSTSSG